MDHAFTWKLSEFDLEGATYRYRVRVQGERIGGYREYLRVPEAWQRDYRDLRSRNQAAGAVASALMTLTFIAMVVFLVINVRGHDVRWRTVTLFSGIAFILALLAQLNSLPTTAYYFDTKDTYASFWTGVLLSGVIASLAQGAGIGFLVAAAEPVYRRAYGGQVSLSKLFTPAGIRTKRFITGTVIGLALTSIFVAYQTVFYIVAGRFGAWSPADIPYSEMLNTYVPWAVVLLIGFMPAVSEELTSRAFSIPFFERFLKLRWAAVVVSALIWGFAHSGYPQQPFFIRGVEVGIAGIVVGYVMLRWGLLPVLVWHYTIDALYTALILLRSSNAYFVVTAALSVGLMLLPLAAAIVLHLRERRFTDPAPLLNESESPPRTAEPASSGSAIPAVETVPVARAAELPRRPAIMAAAAALAVFFLVDAESPFDDVDLAVTRGEAGALAAAHLDEMEVDAESYRSVITFQSLTSGNVMRYRMEREGLPSVASLYREHLPPAAWRVRFFRTQEEEEYQVWVDPGDGSVQSVLHVLPEEAPGADLSEDEARAIAQEHLRAFGTEPEGLELKESSSEKLEARRDHTFVWEAREGDPRNLDESRFRSQVRIAGDAPSQIWRFVKLPESWLRERGERSTAQVVSGGILMLLGVVIFAHMTLLMIRAIRSGEVSWRLPLRCGLAAVVLTLSSTLNDLPTYFNGYSTETTTTVYAVRRAVSAVLGAGMTGVLVTATLGLVSAMHPGRLESLFRRRSRAELADAAVRAIVALLVVGAVARLVGLASTHFARFASPPGFPFVSGVNTALPFWAGLTSSVGAAYALAVAAAILLFYVVRVLKSPAVAAAVVIVVAAAGAAASSVHPGELYLALGQFLVQAIGSVLVLVFVLRAHALAYVLLGFLSATVQGVYAMLSQSAALYRIHGALWLVVAVALVAAVYLRARDPAAVETVAAHEPG